MARNVIPATILTLIGAFLLGSPGAFATGESASLSSSGVNFEITPTSANPNGTVAIGTDNLTVSSTCSSGYKLYISTTSNDEDGTSLTNTDNSEYSIPAVSGTIASPTLLNSSASKNHWGFAMASGDTGTASTGFVDSTVSNTSLFASIPTLDNMAVIRQVSSEDNTNLNVYYGVNASSDLTPGSYSNTVMYTMIMPSPCDYTLMFEDGIEDTDPVKSDVTKLPEPTTIGHGDTVNLGGYISEFTREGYSITGWKNLTDDLTYSKDETVDINLTNVDIIKLAPIWTINNYTVSINTVTGISSVSAKIGSGSGTEVNNVSEAIQYGTTVTISYAVSEGYHFTGWEIKNVDTDAEGNPLLKDDDIIQIPSTDTYTFPMPASNVELSPKAEGNKYTVHFNANGGTGEMADVEMTYGSPSTLPESTFTYDGYDFYGWSTEKQAPGIDPSRDYTDGQTGTFNLTASNATGTGKATLYAVWEMSSYDDIMQNWSGCTTLTVSTTENYEDKSTYADLLDTRNNVVYRVRRYNDDACWMTENLRLTPSASDPGASTIDSGLLAVNTTTSQGSGTITFTSSDFNSSTAGGLRAFYGGNATDGAYYTWSAALVVCPAGWALPTEAQYTTFLTKEDIASTSAGSTKIHSDPYLFPYSGAYFDNSLVKDGRGLYRASGYIDTEDTEYLLIRDSQVTTYPDAPEYGGLSVRCIQENSATMQSFTASECAELTASTTENYEDKSTYRILRDTRNSVFYTVRRYADNMCWMANNLALTPGDTAPMADVTSGSRTLTATDSQKAGTVTFVSKFDTGLSTKIYGKYDIGNESPSENTGYYSWAAAKLVCPASWTLPTRAQWRTFLSSEKIADSAVGSSLIQQLPYNFAYTGWYNASTLVNPTIAHYRSATASSTYSGNNYDLHIKEDVVNADADTCNCRGVAVRCLHS